MPYSKLALCLAVLGGSLLSCRPADSERSAGDSFMHSSEFPPLSRLVHLDAEALAEGGIRDAYVRLKPELAKHIAQPADLEQILPNDGTRYSILCLGREHVVWGGRLRSRRFLGTSDVRVLRDRQRPTRGHFVQVLRAERRQRSRRSLAVGGGVRTMASRSVQEARVALSAHRTGTVVRSTTLSELG